MTGIIIAGAAGRMGRILLRCAQEFDNLRIVAALERPGDPSVGKNAGTLAGLDKPGVVISDDFTAAPQADVLIDFSARSSTVEHARIAAGRGIGMIIGTTGLDDKEAAAVRKATKRIPIVWSPNMSLGVNVLLALVSKAAAMLDLRYDVEITEVHHKHKKDAPSGTALKLAEAVATARKQKLSNVAIYGRSGQTGERPAGQIAIHAVRMGDVIGDHTVCLATDGERIELTHRASSRDAFAVGALRAALWIKGKKPGMYSMNDVLGL